MCSRQRSGYRVNKTNMAAASLLRKLSNAHDRAQVNICDVLEELRSSTKGQLTYDYEWKPSFQALEDCSRAPLLSPEGLSLKLDLSTDLLDGGSSEDGELKIYHKGKYSGISNFPYTESTELLEKELQASYDVSHVTIYRYDKAKEHEAKQKCRKRREMLEACSRKLEEEKRHYLQEKEDERVREFIRSVQAMQEDEKRKSEEARQRQRELEKSHQEIAEKAVRKVREVEKMRLRVLEEEQRNKKELQKLSESCQSIQVTAVEVQNTFQGSKAQSFLASSMPELLNEVNKVLQVSKDILDQAEKNGKPTEMNVKIMQECSVIIQNILQKAKALVLGAESKAAKEEAERQSKEEAKVKLEEAKVKLEDEKRYLTEKTASSPSQQKQQASVMEDKTAVASTKQRPGISKELACCISATAWAEYSRLASYKSEVIKAAEALTTDTTKHVKQYKFDLHKAVTTPINAISDQSPSHLLDKVERLTKLLSGQSVQVGGKQVSTSSHTAAQSFCRELLARKLVQQGSQQVSSSHNSAFPIAAVAIGIWSKFPDVGELILAQFYEQCPFLVPFYIPKTAGLSDAEYFASLGYLCLDGEVEQQDKFLKRMTGLVRLYAAVISSTLPTGQSKNLHGLDKGWTWLARMMNLEPRPDYTATALYEFLAVAGHALMKEYKKQFGKLLSTLVVDYVPKIEKVTTKTQMGPVVRLRVFLGTCLKNQHIPAPDGYLHPQWWRSSGF